jgi:hypothetical protein
MFSCKGLHGFFAFLLASAFSFAQQKPNEYYEVVANDSVILYFNRDFSLTGKDCADFLRRTRVTENGDFNGYFEDRDTEGLLLGRGTYRRGVKHGYFEFYYQSGILFCAGFYENDKPVGTWEYFYQSGIPERTIKFYDTTATLVQHMDFRGQPKVQLGNGKFEGVIAGELPSYVIGQVVAGRPDGKWYIPAFNGSSIYTERFENGRLIKTSLVPKRKMTAGYPSRLDKFFLGNYLSLLEKFKFQTCNEAQQYHVSSNSDDARLFNYHLRRRINNLIMLNVGFRKSDYYQLGDNYMTVQFSIDDKGKPYDIKLVSPWGDYFFETARNSLNRAVFSTRQKTMYFHLKFSYNNGLRYKYSFKFSRRDRRPKRQVMAD